MLVFAPAAMAQTDYDCTDFATQEEAQQFLLAGDPYGLDADGDGTACDNLPSGGTGGTGTGGGTAPDVQYTPTQGDMDCADFASQAEAQAALDADPSDPNGLDADDDGIACETPADDGATDDGTVTGGGTATGLPATGGASFLLPAAGVLLLGTGLVAAGFARRSR